MDCGKNQNFKFEKQEKYTDWNVSKPGKTMKSFSTFFVCPHFMRQLQEKTWEKQFPKP